MIFLAMLSVILLYMLMTLLSILSVSKHLICGNNLDWLLNLNLIYQTLWTGVRSGLLISMIEKLSWFRLTSLITMVLLMWKWMGLFMRKNRLLRWWGWPSVLNWIGALTLSVLLKLPVQKFALWSFFLRWLLCISINLPYAHVWNTVVTSRLVPLVAILLNPWLITKIWPAWLFSIGITLVDVLQNWLNWCHFLFLEGGLLNILMDCMIFLSPSLDFTRMSLSTVSFLPS